MVQFLISNKANVNIKSESGETPLLSAVGKKDINIAIVKTLLDRGADLTATLGGHSPLGISVTQGRPDLVELLLQKKADPNTEELWNVQVIHRNTQYNADRPVTPLILAICWNTDAHSKIAKILLQHSANPNLADENGDTPLDYAIEQVNTNIITELILHHADVNAPDKQGDPPLAHVWRGGDDSEQIKQMLIQAGANEDYQRRGGIFITQKGTGSIGDKVFVKGANSINRYTLFELVASAYESRGFGGGGRFRGGGFPGVGRGSPAIAFPDFAHVAINRLKVDGSKEEIAVDLSQAFQSEDCSKNPWLEWGDIILIPQLDHKVNENWQGLGYSERETLAKCLMRKVKVVVKGQTTQFSLVPPIAEPGAFPPGEVHAGPLADILNGGHNLYSLDLHSVVHEANVLLISSDLSRVKVTRQGSKTGEPPLVMEFNLTTDPPPDVRLSDGDVIEIREREQK